MKERPERKVIFEITGDGLTAEEVGRIRQVIRHLKGRRSEKRSSHYGRSRPGVDPDGERRSGCNTAYGFGKEYGT